MMKIRDPRQWGIVSGASVRSFVMSPSLAFRSAICEAVRQSSNLMPWSFNDLLALKAACLSLTVWQQTNTGLALDELTADDPILLTERMEVDMKPCWPAASSSRVLTVCCKTGPSCWLSSGKPNIIREASFSFSSMRSSRVRIPLLAS